MCNNCPICFEELNSSNGNFLRLKCHHEFHFKCIFDLLATNSSYNNKCPMCRDDIIEVDRVKIQEKQSELFRVLLYLHEELREVEQVNTYLGIILVVVFFVATIYANLFYITNPEAFWATCDFFKMISWVIISPFIATANGIFFMYVHFIYPFIPYIMSILVLGMFTLMSGGFIPVLN